MNDKRYISNTSTNETCQRRTTLLLADFLQSELHEGNTMLVKVN